MTALEMQCTKKCENGKAQPAFDITLVVDKGGKTFDGDMSEQPPEAYKCHYCLADATLVVTKPRRFYAILDLPYDTPYPMASDVDVRLNTNLPIKDCVATTYNSLATLLADRDGKRGAFAGSDGDR